MREQYFSNSSNTINISFEIDPYCTNMQMGPLMIFICSLPCALVTIPASVWILWILVRRRCGGLSNDTYMLNLTIVDFLHSASVLPLSLNYLIFKTQLISRVSSVLIWLVICGRPLMNVFICVDCFVAVVFPLTYLKIKDKPYRSLVCLLVWIVTLSLQNVPSIRPILVLYPLCLSTIAFCNICILHALRKPDPSGKTKVHPQKQRALQVIINSLVMCLVSYLPPMVGQILSILKSVEMQELMCHIVVPSYVGPCLGSMIMPVLYLGNLGKLKLGRKR